MAERTVGSVGERRKRFLLGRKGKRMRIGKNLRRTVGLLRDDSGSQMVELAFAVTILLALFFGIMDFSRAMYCYHYVTYAAQDGARYAMVRGGDAGTSSCTSTTPYDCITSSSDVQSHIKSQGFPLIDPNNLTVNTTWPGTSPGCVSNCSACSPAANANSQGCLVKVQVVYNFNFMLPFLPRTSGLTFAGTSQKVIQ